MSKNKDFANMAKVFVDLSARDIDGNLVNFDSLRLTSNNQFGKKAFLIVNVASAWGLTKSNYQELVQLHKEFEGQGLWIMGFPCNQFANEEQASNAEISKFVKNDFGVEFQMFAKIEVNGPHCHPIYKFLTANSVLAKDNNQIRDIPWNFAKFLIDRHGNVVDFFEPEVNPLKLSDQINKLIQ